MDRQTGVLVIGLGVAIVLVGLLIMTGALGWFGRLPGDIRIEGERGSFYMPITSMLIASLALTALFAVLRRLF